MPTIYGNHELWASQALTVSGGATPTATTGALRFKHGVPETLLWTVTASSGDPDVTFSYAVSGDGTNFSAFTDIVAASGGTHTNSSGGLNSYILALDPAPYYKFKVTNDDASDTMTVSAAVRLATEGLE